ncbi:MAG: alpha/beta hydrolase [Pseudomonadota bacterium]
MPRTNATAIFAASILTLSACVAAPGPAALAESAPAPFTSLEEAPIVFRANDGQETDAFEGALQVPENRSDPNSRFITLRYVRFPSTRAKAGPPIVYLAGGPGGSGVATAKWRRFPLFMAMRQFGDVIALDQRGTGASDAPEECVSSVVVPAAERTSDAAFADLHRQSARECAAFWAAQGVDLAGYTTAESVADLDALRRHLGAEKMSLWGISYGSHLALAAMKAMPERIDRVVIASVEGLDQTVKLPSRTDDYFARLGETAGVDDLPALIRRVHERLDADPQMLDLKSPDGESVPYLLHRRDMQMIASAMIADPERALMLVRLYQAADAGVYDPIAQVLGRFAKPGAPISWRAMPLAMDRASGVSDARLARVREEAKASLLGDYLNFPMPHIIDELVDLDLGPAFRRDPQSDIPTLVLTGSLDGRTYPAGQEDATAGLKNAVRVRVDGAGHNLFMASPDVQAVMEDFMRGEPVRTHVIETAKP